MKTFSRALFPLLAERSRRGHKADSSHTAGVRLLTPAATVKWEAFFLKSALLFSLALVACLEPEILAQPGSIDAAFTMAVTGVYPTAVASQPDGKVLIGGGFIRVNGQERGGLARLNADGSLDSTFIVGAGAQVITPGFSIPGTGISFPATTLPGAAQAIAVQPDGRILIGGGFTHFNGVARPKFARLLSDGSFDPAFDPGKGAEDGDILSIQVLADGKILLGGSFKKFNGVTTGMGSIRLNSNGSIDSGFNAGGNGLFGGIPAVALADGRIVAVGAGFSGAQIVSKIVRLNSNGQLDSTFTLGAGSTVAIAKIAVQPDGKILAGGGGLKTYNGAPVKNIFRLNADGSLDTTFDATPSDPTALLGLAVRENGQILAGGVLKGGKAMLRLNPDGSIDTTFAAALGLGVYGLVLQPEGRILVSASVLANGGVQFGLVRLNGDGAGTLVLPTIGTQPASQTVTAGARVEFSVTAAGSAPLSYRWRRNGVEIPNETAATFTIPNAAPDHSGIYTVLVGNAAGTVLSEAATLTVNVPVESVVIVTHPRSVTVSPGETATFSVEAGGTGPFTYEWQLDGLAIPGATQSTLTLLNVQPGPFLRMVTAIVSNSRGSATSQVAVLTVLTEPPVITGHPVSQVVALGTGASWTVAALANRTLTMTILGGAAPFPTAGTYQIILSGAGTYSIPAAAGIAAASGTFSAISDLGISTVLVLNNYFSGGGAAKVALLEQGIYEMYADNLVNNQHGTYVSTPALPLATGPDVTFEVEAAGAGPLAYQWRLNGNNLPGENAAVLTIRNAEFTDLGRYSVLVSNSAGSVASNDAILSVGATPLPPAITFRFTGASRLTFEWPSGFVLQATPKLGGDWEDVPGTPPLNIPTTGDGRFFRLIQR